MNNTRLDLLLSYWILFWYLLYITGIITSSPKLIIILEIILLPVLYFIHLSTQQSINKHIIIIIIIQLFIKLIPLYTLRDEEIDYSTDIRRIIVIVLLYLLWIYLNNKSLNDLYIKHHYMPVTRLITKQFK
jgi:hypothetical protein